MTNKKCSIDGCTNKYKAKGFCAKHYVRRNLQNIEYVKPEKIVRKCSINGCEGKYAARGMCMTHYKQVMVRTYTDKAKEYEKIRYQRIKNNPIAMEKKRVYRNLPDVKLKTKNKYLQRTFNITLDQYNILLKQQDNKCFICKRDQSEFSKALSVDHNHSCCPGKESCGKCVRGLLCDLCNYLIGYCNDNTKTLVEAIKYIEKYKLIPGEKSANLS